MTFYGNLTMKAKLQTNYVPGVSLFKKIIVGVRGYIYNTNREKEPLFISRLKFQIHSFFKMLCNYRQNLVLIVLSSIVSVQSVPKFDEAGFVPSSFSFLNKAAKAQDQIAMPSSHVNVKPDEPTKRIAPDTNEISDRNHDPRFGFTSVGTTGSGYAVSPYAGPAKIDLGGLILGAILGVGSILIIPKILYLLSGSYGTYARSEENGFTQAITRLDDILARHGIDTNSCMQRAVCTYSQQAATDKGDNTEDKLSSFNKIIDTVATNQIFRTAMQGTAIEEALEAGRNGRNCSRIYPHCGFSMETMITLLSTFVSSITAVNPSTVPPTGPTA